MQFIHKKLFRILNRILELSRILLSRINISIHEWSLHHRKDVKLLGNKMSNHAIKMYFNVFIYMQFAAVYM